MQPRTRVLGHQAAECPKMIAEWRFPACIPPARAFSGGCPRVGQAHCRHGGRGFYGVRIEVLRKVTVVIDVRLTVARRPEGSARAPYACVRVGPAIRVPSSLSAGHRTVTEGCGELGASVEVEFVVGAPEVHLDGLDGYEQGLGDVAVAHPAAGHRRDPVLGGGEGVHSGEAGSADARAGCLQLFRRAVAQRRRRAPRGRSRARLGAGRALASGGWRDGSAAP